MIRAHEDSYCPKCKTPTIGPNCHWCGMTETVRYSPAETLARVARYRRFRAAGVTHLDALQLLNHVADLTATSHRTNAAAVRELLDAQKPVEGAPARRPLAVPARVAVAA